MYTIKSRIRYSEVNSNKQLSLFGVINYFQDCSTFQSEDIGKGIDYLKENSRVWVLSSWQIIIKRFPSLFENIEIGTWAYDFTNIYGYRNFVINDESSNMCAVANSIWVLMDTQTSRPVKITQADAEGYIVSPKYEMDEKNRKIIIPNNLSDLPSFTVTKSNIDTNNHVNNGQYIKMAEEFLPTDFEIKQMRAEYKKSALLGDIITPRISTENNIYTIVLTNEEGKPYTIIEFS